MKKSMAIKLARAGISMLPAAFALALLFPGIASATVISLSSPNSVNRILEGQPTNNFSGVFSTFNILNNDQSSLVATSNASLLGALNGILGALGSGQSYSITSAILTAGGADDYAVASKAHLFLSGFDPNNFTWNNCANGAGCVSGSDYETIASATGFVDGSSTSWDLTSDVADALASTNDFNFFFPAFGGTGDSNTFTANVSWSIDATITEAPLDIEEKPKVPPIPEPATLALFGVGLLGLGAARRRKKRAA